MRSTKRSSSIAGPMPTRPATSNRSTSRSAPAASAAAATRCARSQVRGEGHARPCDTTSTGTWRSSDGRAVRNPTTTARQRVSNEARSAGTGATGCGCQPRIIPALHDAMSASQSRWQNLFASGAERSSPPAESSGGLAAATKETVGGSRRSPTSRSSTTRSMAACTDGEAVVSSSRNTTVSGRSRQRTAQRGGANVTDAPSRTGSPAKSEASLTLPMTTSHGRPSCSATCSRRRDLPSPGPPHSRTGWPICTATAKASRTWPDDPRFSWDIPPSDSCSDDINTNRRS